MPKRTVIVPGIEDVDAPISPKVLNTLRAAAARGARIASICTGAFILAKAGLLSGRRATTHWLAAPARPLRRRLRGIAVMPLAREGGQAQFIVQPPSASSGNLTSLFEWLDRNLHRPITVEDMAQRAAKSIRTFNRRFREQTGTTPLQWLLCARAKGAIIARNDRYSDRASRRTRGIRVRSRIQRPIQADSGRESGRLPADVRPAGLTAAR